VEAAVMGVVRSFSVPKPDPLMTVVSQWAGCGIFCV
jgi:hypothetical protein